MKRRSIAVILVTTLALNITSCGIVDINNIKDTETTIEKIKGTEKEETTEANSEKKEANSEKTEDSSQASTDNSETTEQISIKFPTDKFEADIAFEKNGSTTDISVSRVGSLTIITLNKGAITYRILTELTENGRQITTQLESSFEYGDSQQNIESRSYSSIFLESDITNLKTLLQNNELDTDVYVHADATPVESDNESYLKYEYTNGTSIATDGNGTDSSKYEHYVYIIDKDTKELVELDRTKNNNTVVCKIKSIDGLDLTKLNSKDAEELTVDNMTRQILYVITKILYSQNLDEVTLDDFLASLEQIDTIKSDIKDIIIESILDN